MPEEPKGPQEPEGDDALTRILDSGIVGVVRAESPDTAFRTARALLAGGMRIVEIAFTTPDAGSVVARLRKAAESGEVDGEMTVGAGTIIDAGTARVAILEGAQFVVGPTISEGAARTCDHHSVPYVPGASTPTEIVRGIELGAGLVKVFPAGTLGPGFIRAVLGPLPGTRLMPTGGVTPENVADWIAAGAAAIGAGGALTVGARSGDYAAVTDMARRFVDAVRDARAQFGGGPGR